MDTKLQFRCENCGGAFLKDRSDEDAEAEMRANWGDLPEEDQSYLCENCYREFKAWYEKEHGRKLQ